MRIAMALLAMSLALGTGCGKKKGGDADKGSGSAQMTGSDTAGSSAGSGSAMAAGSGSDSGSGSAAAGSGSGTVGPNGQAMAHKGGMCPSTVFGSTTTAEVKDKTVVITVVAEDKDAIDAIQHRAEAIVKEKSDGGSPAGSGSGHDQKGSHGGGMGICPVHLPEGATAVAAKTDKGATITVTPKGALDSYKSEVDARIKSAAEWVKTNVQAGDKGTGGGVGGGSGNDGMNHSGQGDGKGMERKAAGSGSGSGSATKGDGGGGGAGTGGGGGKGTGGGAGGGSGKNK